MITEDYIESHRPEVASLTSDTSKFRLDYTGALVESFQIPGELECGSGGKENHKIAIVTVGPD